MDPKKLCDLACNAMHNAWAPYSGFSVGAALIAKDGTVYTGCNIENAAFTPTVCAERVAFFKAIEAGQREFRAIAIAGGKGDCMPCGVCRQVMAEFCGPEFLVYSVTAEGTYREFTLGQLLPFSFSAETMGESHERM